MISGNSPSSSGWTPYSPPAPDSSLISAASTSRLEDIEELSVELVVTIPRTHGSARSRRSNKDQSIIEQRRSEKTSKLTGLVRSLTGQKTSTPPITPIKEPPPPTYHSLFDALKIEKLIPDPKLMYLPRRYTSDIQFVDIASFNRIRVPLIQTENCVSRCHEDPLASFNDEPLFPGAIDPPFKTLQRLSREHGTDPRLIGASSINNYLRNNPIEQIFCDASWVGYFPASNCSLSIVADGCGTGMGSREAAQRAVVATRKYILDHLQHEQDLEGFIQVVLDSLKFAHCALIQDVNQSRTTTINICFTFTSLTGENYILVTGLGDTKCYLLDEETHEVLDLSQGTRAYFNLYNPGGALGGFIAHCRRCEQYTVPYLINLSVICCRLPPKRNFLVFNFTDGVSDNMNPEVLKIKPSEFHPPLALLAEESSPLNWKQLPPRIRSKIHTKFATELFAKIVSECPLSDLNVVCDAVIKYCRDITEPLRLALESGETTDASFLGKLDHAAIVVARVLATDPS